MERVTGYVMGLITVGAAMFVFSGLVEGIAQTRPNGWTIAADQLLHGTPGA